jgi:hypothetical protein
MRLLALVIPLSLGCITGAPIHSTPTPAAAFRVVGYLPSWSEPRAPMLKVINETVASSAGARR